MASIPTLLPEVSKWRRDHHAKKTSARNGAKFGTFLGGGGGVERKKREGRPKNGEKRGGEGEKR